MIGIGINIGNRAAAFGGTAVVVPVATAATSIGSTSFTANWNAFSGANYYLLDVSLSSSFSTFVLQDTVVLTTSYNVTGLTSNTTYYYRVRAVTGSDSDAMAFVSRVYVASGTLSYNEVNATNQLVLDLKSYSIWTKMKAIYPMVGASAAACTQNLVSSSFTGTFNGGWTYASTGVTPNGTNGYMDTGLAPNGNLSTSSTHISSYSRSSSANTNDCLIGCYRSSPNDGLRIMKFGSDYYCENYVTYINNNFGYSTHSGLFITTRITSNSYKVFRNTTNIFSKTQNSSTLPTETLWIGANHEGSGAQFSNRECAFASIGDGLSDTEASNFYTAVQAFNTTLLRQV